MDHCYGLKRFLRELGMAWNETAQAWTCSRSHAAAILNMSREEEVTADLVLEAIAGSSHKAVSSSKSKTNKLPYAIMLEEKGGEGKSRILIRNSYDIKDRCRSEGLRWVSKVRTALLLLPPHVTAGERMELRSEGGGKAGQRER